MIFKNIDFHNVSEITKDGDGSYVLRRFPLSVEEKMELGQKANKASSGVELRFKMKSPTVTVKLKFPAEPEATTHLYLFRGSVVGRWEEYLHYLRGGETKEIVIKKHEVPHRLKEVTGSANYPYSEEVIRLVFNRAPIRFVGIEGEVEPPSIDNLPKRRYLAYGSSITHGSMAIGMTENFVSRVGAHFRADVRNLGLAGACLLESAVADEIAEMGMRGEWDFATLCLGINRLRTPREEIRALVDYMIGTIAGKNPTKHIFCISPMYSNTDFCGDVLADIWREEIRRSVRRYGSPYVHYVSGISLIGRMDGLSGDLVHPSPDGVRMISERLVRIMRRFIK
jgi:hypothetical protein